METVAHGCLGVGTGGGETSRGLKVLCYLEKETRPLLFLLQLQCFSGTKSGWRRCSPTRLSRSEAGWGNAKNGGENEGGVGEKHRKEVNFPASEKVRKSFWRGYVPKRLNVY